MEENEKYLVCLGMGTEIHKMEEMLEDEEEDTLELIDLVMR